MALSLYKELSRDGQMAQSQSVVRTGPVSRLAAAAVSFLALQSSVCKAATSQAYQGRSICWRPLPSVLSFACCRKDVAFPVRHSTAPVNGIVIGCESPSRILCV